MCGDRMKADGVYIFGTVKVGERGQIVIPKKARDMFNINPGDLLLVLSNEHIMGRDGIVIIKADKIKEFALNILKEMESPSE